MNKVIKLVAFSLIIACNATAQSFLDNPYKVWSYRNKNAITNQNVHISRADADSEKIFTSVAKGESFPQEIWKYKKLKVIEVGGVYNSCCSFVGAIPAELNTLNDLEYIFFSGIGVSKLPADLSNLTNLKSIYISEAPAAEAILDQLPNFSQLPALEVVFMDLNKKTVISDAANFNTLFEVEGLKGLVLNNANLTSEALSSLSKLDSLQILELMDNNLTTSPDFGSYESLKQLSLRSNKIEKLTPAIGNFKNLELLDIAHNNLSELPESFGNLKSVIFLDLSENELEKLPESLAGLENLEHLILRGNNLKELPEAIYKLKNLKEIDLMSTQIAELDPKIINTNIEIIRISHQQDEGFSFDPNMLAKMKSLKRLQFSNRKVEKGIQKSKKKLEKLRPDISM